MVAASFRKARRREIALADALRAAENFKADFRNQYQVVEITEGLADLAMSLAQQHSLRGYDAVQLAAASELHTLHSRTGLPPLIFISADTVLNTDARAEGLVADDPNEHI